MQQQWPPPTSLDYLGPGAQPPPTRRRGWIVWVALAVGAGFLFLLLRPGRPPGAVGRISLSDLTVRLQTGQVRSMAIGRDEISGTFYRPQIMTDGRPVRTFRADAPRGASENWAFIQWVLESRGSADVTIENNDSLLVNILLPLIPWLLIFGFIWFFVFRQLRNSAKVAARPGAQVLISGPGRWTPDGPIQPEPLPDGVPLAGGGPGAGRR